MALEDGYSEIAPSFCHALPSPAVSEVEPSEYETMILVSTFGRISLLAGAVALGAGVGDNSKPGEAEGDGAEVGLGVGLSARGGPASGWGVEIGVGIRLGVGDGVGVSARGGPASGWGAELGLAVASDIVVSPEAGKVSPA